MICNYFVRNILCYSTTNFCVQVFSAVVRVTK